MYWDNIIDLAHKAFPKVMHFQDIGTVLGQ
jgi:hypothetical protein